MKIKGIEKYFENREKSLEDERKIKYSETFYTELFFLCLYEIDANLYSKLIMLKENQEKENNELFLEPFFKENLPSDIYRKLRLKIDNSNYEIFKDKKDDFILDFEKDYSENSYNLLDYLQKTLNLQKVPIYKTNNMEKIKKEEGETGAGQASANDDSVDGGSVYNGELKRKIRFIK